MALWVQVAPASRPLHLDCIALHYICSWRPGCQAGVRKEVGRANS